VAPSNEAVSEGGEIPRLGCTPLGNLTNPEQYLLPHFTFEKAAGNAFASELPHVGGLTKETFRRLQYLYRLHG